MKNCYSHLTFTRLDLMFCGCPYGSLLHASIPSHPPPLAATVVFYAPKICFLYSNDFLIEMWMFLHISVFFGGSKHDIFGMKYKSFQSLQWPTLSDIDIEMQLTGKWGMSGFQGFREWSPSRGCCINLCTQIYMQRFGEVSNLMFIKYAVHFKIHFVVIPFSSFWI